MNMMRLCGSLTSASPRTRSARDLPLLVQLARERGEGALALVDRAAGAERPAAGPGGEPVGAAAGEPAALAVAHDAERGDRRRRVAVDQAQRPAQRLQLDVQRVALGLEADEPRAGAVVAGRATVAQGGDGGVGGADLRRRRRRRPRRARPRAPGRRPKGRGPAARVPALASSTSKGTLAASWSARPRTCIRSTATGGSSPTRSARTAGRSSGRACGPSVWRVSAGVGTVYATTVARPRGDGEAYNIVAGRSRRGVPDDEPVVGVAPEDVVVGARVRVGVARRRGGERRAGPGLRARRGAA